MSSSMPTGCSRAWNHVLVYWCSKYLRSVASGLGMQQCLMTIRMSSQKRQCILCMQPALLLDSLTMQLATRIGWCHFQVIDYWITSPGHIWLIRDVCLLLCPCKGSSISRCPSLHMQIPTAYAQVLCVLFAITAICHRYLQLAEPHRPIAPGCQIMV